MASPIVFSDNQLPVERGIEQELKSAHESGGIAAVLACVEKANEEYKSVEINIAVLGEIKAGKSTLINSLRDLSADDEGAAEVGVTQTTMEPKGYPHPNNPKIIFWDLPGAGSSEFPAANYLKQMKVERYDFYLLVADTAFKEIYKDIALCIKAMGKGMIFVRTKVDVAVSGDMIAHPKKHNEGQVLTKIRKEISERLKDAYLSSKVFLINSYNKDKYDYPDLLKCLLTDFAKEKRNALILSLNAVNDHMVDKKVEIISKDISWWMAAAAFVPCSMPSLVNRIVIEALKSFLKKMGLDESSIERLIKNHPEHETELRTIIQKIGISQFISVEGLENRRSNYWLLANMVMPPLGVILSIEDVRRRLRAGLKFFQFTTKRLLQAATGKILDVPLEEALLNNPDFAIEHQMPE